MMHHTLYLIEQSTIHNPRVSIRGVSIVYVAGSSGSKLRVNDAPAVPPPPPFEASREILISNDTPSFCIERELAGIVVLVFFLNRRRSSTPSADRRT
jgi:hypothetical protein